MPFIDPALRQSIQERLETGKRIEESFKGRKYVHMNCRLCNWGSNGLTLDEASKANKAHEKTHPEYEGWAASIIPLDEMRDYLHDHECEMGNCICVCGCQEGPFCTLIFGELCSVCTVRVNRGDTHHGYQP